MHNNVYNLPAGRQVNCFGKFLFGKFLQNFLWQVFVY